MPPVGARAGVLAGAVKREAEVALHPLKRCQPALPPQRSTDDAVFAWRHFVCKCHWRAHFNEGRWEGRTESSVSPDTGQQEARAASGGTTRQRVLKVSACGEAGGHVGFFISRVFP